MITQKKSPHERLEEIQEKSQKLIQAAVQINTKIETANENKKRLMSTLVEKYHTSDIATLETILVQWEQENENELKKAEDSLLLLEREIQEKNEKIKKIHQG